MLLNGLCERMMKLQEISRSVFSEPINHKIRVILLRREKYLGEVFLVRIQVLNFLIICQVVSKMVLSILLMDEVIFQILISKNNSKMMEWIFIRMKSFMLSFVTGMVAPKYKMKMLSIKISTSSSMKEIIKLENLILRVNDISTYDLFLRCKKVENWIHLK